PAEQVKFNPVLIEQLRNQAVIKPDERHRSACEGVDDCAITRRFRRNSFFDPESQPVEAPRRCPPEQRTKQKSVDQFAERTKSRLIVVPGEKSDCGVPGRPRPAAVP